MYSKTQEELLQKFAQLSDNLFDLGIIRTDNFVGEIGEYIACRHFELNKLSRSSKGADGISKAGERYQIKSTVTGLNIRYNLKGLNTVFFDYLVIVFFDKNLRLQRLIRIPSKQVHSFNAISARNIALFEQFDSAKIKLPITVLKAIDEFAQVYNKLEINGITRSRRIVGDIGEFYASKRLGLILSNNKNEKGIDARHLNGLTFEIKTRRVYLSERRVSEVRRLNNLVGKSADYLIVVIIDRAFKCVGMWLVPIKNLTNLKSAKLELVNNTKGVLNLIPSQIPYLNNRESFEDFDSISEASEVKSNLNKETSILINEDVYGSDFFISCIKWIIVAILVFVVIAFLFGE